jgi:hypothetical protein
MRKLIALVVDERPFDELSLLETARSMGFGAELCIERRKQTSEVFDNLTAFRELIEQHLADPQVASVAFLFPPCLADEVNFLQLVSGVNFTWDMFPSDAVAGITSMSARRQGLIIYGRAGPDSWSDSGSRRPSA